MAFAQPGERAFEHVLARAEDVDAVAAPLGEREQLQHQVDARHALGQRVAEEARRPDDRLPVGADELAAVDDPRSAASWRMATILAALTAMCCAPARVRT